MLEWKIDRPKGLAVMALFGGELVVRRDAGLLMARWTAPGLELNTNLAHIGRFAIRHAALQGISQAEGDEMLRAKWLGLQRPWADTEATLAFEAQLHGRAVLQDGGGVSIEVEGAACWVAPVAIRTHLAMVERRYFAAHHDEAPPGLFVADTDPI